MEYMENKDDFSMYFEWKRNIERYKVFKDLLNENMSDITDRLSRCSSFPVDDEIEEQHQKFHEMSETQEVRLFQMWKHVETADEDLKKTKQHFKEKMVEFDERWERIRKGRKAIETNKKKFKHFIREKQVKIEEGEERIEHEKQLQWEKVKELKELKRDSKIHSVAKKSLERCAEQRKVFAEYLGKVVKNNPDSYSDIRSLIERCQALIETRLGLKHCTGAITLLFNIAHKANKKLDFIFSKKSTY